MIRAVRSRMYSSETAWRRRLYARVRLRVYGDSMISAECIFSQSAPGEVSSAYFRKLAHISGGGVQIFATVPNAHLK